MHRLQFPGRIIDVSTVYGGGLKLTIPKRVREILRLKDGDKIIWYLNDRGELCIVKIEEVGRVLREPV